jgi:hypothetical protein
MTWALALGVCAAANVVLGSIAGYTSASSYLSFWVSIALVVSSSRRITARWWADAAALERAVRDAVVAVAIVVATMLTLGAAARLTPVNASIALALVFAATRTLRVPPRTAALERETPDVPTAAIAIVASLIAFAIAFAATHAPLTLYDSVSYHLFFAARWVQDHAIAIIPTPFGDEAQAYAPGNGELVFAWLMLPFHGDLFARMGQLPFAILAAATLFVIARRLGASAGHALYPAIFFLLSRPILEQLVGANVDLICAALFLSTLWFTIAAVDRDGASDWALAGVAAGLYFGTKYLALVYAPVLLLLVFARGPRRRALWALPGIAAFALPWYMRNWIVAGSPIYPATLAVGGVTIARGAFTRDAMLNTVFHTTDVRLFPAMAAHAFGPALIIVWLPCAIAGWIVMARRGWWPSGALALVPLLMAPLYWFGFPVNVDSRFLMPAIAPALLPFAFLFSANRRWNNAVHAGYALAMVWLVVGGSISLPARVPWFMDGWLSLGGLVAPRFLAWFGITTAMFAGAWSLARRTAHATAAIGVASIVLVGSVLTAIAPRVCDGRCDYLQTTSPFIRPAYLDSWQWIDANIRNATIAYTGINLPYPLAGPQLTNKVVYVNIDGRARWRFHDYDRAYRTGRFAPTEPVLATSSGELMPVASRTGPRDDALRPRYERMQGIRDAWIFNLDTMGVRYLFVGALSAYEIDYVWHNDGGFPIEDEWASSDPVRFRRVYDNMQVHIYAVDTGKKASA